MPDEGWFFSGCTHNYCCICQVSNHYSIHDLNLIKKIFFKLSKYYYDILGDITEVKKVSGSDDDFWDDEIKFKYRNHETGKNRNHETGTKSGSFLSDSL